MFWGLTLKSGKKYTQTIKNAFHLSQAALDGLSSSEEAIQVVLNSEAQNYVLCTLKKNKVDQVPLDLNFATGEVISFSSTGNGTVHLTGYLVPDLDEFGDDGDLTQPGMEGLDGEEASDDEDESDDIDITEDVGQDDEDSSDEDEDESDDDDDEEEEEEEVMEPKPKQIKLDKGSKQNGLEKKEVEGKKKDKKNKQKQKAQNQQQDSSNKSGEKTLQNGVKVQDIRVGNGPEAKPGKKVQVLYEGRLKSNNKLFDSSKTGIKFGLGKGEVIKGWDIGLNGMKVGGKRRIICPPNAAYGAKGSPPYIPPNSTLVFEVELKSVN